MEIGVRALLDLDRDVVGRLVVVEQRLHLWRVVAGHGENDGRALAEKRGGERRSLRDGAECRRRSARGGAFEEWCADRSATALSWWC